MNWRLALSTQAALVQSGWVGVRLMIGYRAVELGADALWLGVIAACFAVPALFAALPIGRLSDRVGGSRVSLIGIGLFVVGVALIYLPADLIAVIAAALLVGLGNAFVMVGQQTFVAHRARGGASEGGFATLTTAASLGQLIAPPLVTAVATIGAVSAGAPNTLLGAAACILLALLGLVGSAPLQRADRADPRPSDASEEPFGLRDLTRVPGLLRSMLVSGAVLVTIDLLYAYIPLWASEREVPAVVVGALLAVRAAVSVFSRIGLERLVALLGRKLVLCLALVAGVGALIALPLVGAIGAIPVMIGLGLALGIPQPLTMAWVVRITPAAVHGAALGMRITANRLAQIALPVGIGATVGGLGSAGVYWANAALLAAAIAVVGRSRL